MQTAKPNKASVGGWQELQLTYQTKEHETVEVSVVNASARVSALFDDLVLTTEPPLVVQENHYDPWGLNLAGIEVTGNPEHRYQYINREKQDEFGLGWLDFEARMYDPQCGCFHSVDPLPDTEGQESLSPYQYAWNNPVNKSDPDGKMPGDPPSGASLAVHTVLDVVGLIPAFGEIADGANALIYLAEGNHTDAALSAAAMIPIAGWAATAGKAVRTADKMVDAAKTVERLDDGRTVVNGVVRGNANKAAKTSDGFIAHESGVAVHKNANEAKKSLTDAGFTGKPSTETSETGTIIYCAIKNT